MDIEKLAREALGEPYDVPTLGVHGQRMVNSADLARFAALVVEECAKEFDRRDKGVGGFYDPHEPAEIIRAQVPPQSDDSAR